MMVPAEELRTVHMDRVKNIGKLHDGKWVWPVALAFTSRPSDQPSNQQNPASCNQPIPDEPTTNPYNLVAPGDNNPLDLSPPTMHKRSRVQGGFQNPASQSASSPGTTRPNLSPRSGSYFPNSIETLVSPVRALSEVTALEFRTAELAEDGPFMYTKEPKSNSYENPAGDSPTSLTSNKKAIKSTLPKIPDYLDGYENSQLHINKAQPRTQKAENQRKARLSKGQGALNKPTGFAEVEEVPGARTEMKPEYFQLQQVKEVTSSEQLQASTINPQLLLPSKAKTSAERPNNQLPTKSRQAYEPMVIDTLPERYGKDDSPVPHLDATLPPHCNTPPAVKAYRERYLPSIQADPLSNQLKEAAGTTLQFSAPNTSTILSALSPVRLLANEASALPPAETQDEPMLSTHPSVTGSFQTPGAVPYNLTPSPVSSDQGNGFYEPSGGRSSSPSDNGYNMADTPSILVNEVDSILANEAAPTEATLIPVDFAASQIRRGYDSDARAPVIGGARNTDFASSSTLVNHATSRSLRAEFPSTQTPADEKMENEIVLTHAPTPSPAPDVQQPQLGPINLTHSPSPSPELNQHQSFDLTRSPKPTPELEDVAQEHRSQNCDGRAPSTPPERFGITSNKMIPAGNMRGSSKGVGNDISSTEPSNPEAFEVAAPLGLIHPAIGVMKDKAAQHERRLISPKPSAKASTVLDAVESVEANTSFEIAAFADCDAMETDEPAGIVKSVEGNAIEIDEPTEIARYVGGNAMDIDERLSSDLSEVPSDSESYAIEAYTEKLLAAKNIEQALANKLTGPTIPRGTYLPWAPHLAPPLSTISYDEYEFAKEGEYFDLAYVLFRIVPKRVFDKIWTDEHYRPQISLAGGPVRWAPLRDPTIKHAAKPDPSSIDLIDVLSAVEKSLLQIWIDVESIVLMLYAEFDNEFRAKDLTLHFRHHQANIYTEWKRLYAHLVTLTDFKERYFSASNVEKRVLPNNINPYKRLFTMKNSAGILFYGTKEYFNAMKGAIKDAWDAFDCVEMKEPKYKQLRGMNRTALGEEYSNCLDRLREFHTVVRRRDWDVEAYSGDGASENEPSSLMVGSEQYAKGASKESTPKGKGEAVAVEDDLEEKSDDVSDGDPPYYYEDKDEDEDGDDDKDDDGSDRDYFEGDYPHRRGGPQPVLSPTPSKKHGITSRSTSSEDEMTNENGGEFQLQTRGSLHSGAGHVQSPTVTGVRKGAKRLMVEVSDGPSL